VEDDKYALGACLDGLSKNEMEGIAENRGIGISAFYMRTRNFQYLVTDGKKGLSKYSKQSRCVWEEYRKVKQI